MSDAPQSKEQQFTAGQQLWWTGANYAYGYRTKRVPVIFLEYNHYNIKRTAKILFTAWPNTRKESVTTTVSPTTLAPRS